MSSGGTQQGIRVQELRGGTESRLPSRGARAQEPVQLTIEVRDADEELEVRALVEAFLPVFRDQKDRVRDVLDAILPPAALLGVGAAAQSRRNAVLRDEIARTYGLLGASDLAAAAGSRAANAAATATRWRQAGKIFSVPVANTNFYPGFQFGDDGAPLPQMAAVLEVLGRDLRGWELAAWLTQPLDELGGRTPLDAWDSDLPAVVDAAGYLVSTIDNDASL